MAANKNVIIGIRGKVPDKSQRTSVEPPPLGSFSRMPRFITETKSRKAAPRLRRYAKIVSLSALGLSLLAVPLGLWVQSRHDLDQEIVASKPNSQEMVRVANKFPAPREEDAIRLVKLALAKRNVTDLGKIIRMGETSAQEIIEFLGSLQEREGKAEQFDWMAGMDANGLQIEGVLVRFGETHNRLAMLTPDETGTWLMDFDSFARRVKPAWTQILSAPAIEAQVRIYVGRDAYYNGAFSDESRWKCYALASPDCNTLIMGYVKPGSSQHIALESVLGDKAINRAVVKIRRDASMGSRQFEILGVIAEDWVIGDSVYDQRFTPSPGLIAEPSPAGRR